jgi:hypothetical protein
MSKQTSIEWYAKKDGEITIKYLEGKINQIQLAIEKTKCLEQAKQMHKEEIVNAWIVIDNELQRLSAEAYYQETYGGNNE